MGTLQRELKKTIYGKTIAKDLYRRINYIIIVPERYISESSSWKDHSESIFAEGYVMEWSPMKDHCRKIKLRRTNEFRNWNNDKQSFKF